MKVKLPTLSGLRAKYLLICMLLLAVLVACFTTINLYNQRQLVYHRIQSEAISTANLLGEIAVQHYYYFDLEALIVLLKEVRLQEGISYAYFFDAEGKVLTDGTSQDAMRYQAFSSGFGQQAVGLRENRLAFSDDTFDLLRPIKLGNEIYGMLWLGYSLEGLQAELAQVRNRNLQLGFIIFLAATLLVWLLVTTILQPIRRLIEGTQALAKGDFSHRIDLQRNDEFQQLAMSFNTMTRDLERANSELSAGERQQRALVAALPDLLFTFDEAGVCLDYRLGSDTSLASEVVGKRLAEIDIIPRDVSVGLLGRIRQVLTTQESQIIDYRQDNKFFEARLTRIDAQRALMLVRDVTTQKQAEAKLRYKAFHDTLTGLANRTLFMEKLEARLEQARVHNDNFAVMILDLDGFKHVNDSLGHIAGDELLKKVAARFATCVQSRGTVARLGGDEFAILLTQLGSVGEEVRVARLLLDALKKPIKLNNQDIFVGTSIGIALSSPEHHKPGELLRDADIALYKAKDKGRNRFEIYSSALHSQAISRLELENDLHRALAREEFTPHYQPIISLTKGQVTGFEALARWQHPTRGLLYPDAFIELAEETGQIVQIDMLILKEACRQVAAWHGQSGQVLSINANLSGHHFLRADLVERVEAILKESGLPAHKLQLEITETVLMQGSERVADVLNALKALGVQLYLDDFGTGYSSLSYLDRFPIDAIKLERSFIADMLKSEKRSHLVASVIELAHGQGLAVVAEGIEEAAQSEQLKAWNCRFGQGYYFSKPKAAQDIMPFLEHFNASLIDQSNRYASV